MNVEPWKWADFLNRPCKLIEVAETKLDDGIRHVLTFQIEENGERVQVTFVPRDGVTVK